MVERLTLLLRWESGEVHMQAAARVCMFASAASHEFIDSELGCRVIDLERNFSGSDKNNPVSDSHAPDYWKVWKTTGGNLDVNREIGSSWAN